jgi:hypothetical protein
MPAKVGVAENLLAHPTDACCCYMLLHAVAQGVGSPARFMISSNPSG